MGKAMVDLTRSVNAVESNATRLTQEASLAVKDLNTSLASVDKAEGRMDVVLETMDRQSRETWQEYKSRTREAKVGVEQASFLMRDLLRDARALSTLINDQLISSAEMEGRLQRSADSAEQRMAAAEREVAAAKEQISQALATLERERKAISSEIAADLKATMAEMERAAAPEAPEPVSEPVAEPVAEQAVDLAEVRKALAARKAAVAQKIATAKKALATNQAAAPSISEVVEKVTVTKTSAPESVSAAVRSYNPFLETARNEKAAL